MASPSTFILDTFTRANEDPLANGWTGPVINGELVLKLVSNQAVPPTAGTPASSYWNAQQFPADQEAFFTMPTLPGGTTEGGLILRSTNPGGATQTCILVDYQTTSGVFIFDVSNATFTQAGTTMACTMVAGDKLWATVIGSTITVYQYTVGVWTLIGTRTPTTTGAGYIGMFTNGGTVALDDFGGGVISNLPRSDSTNFPKFLLRTLN